MDKRQKTDRFDGGRLEAETAPRWLSGGRSGVKLEDNPTALAYVGFLRALSAIFLKEQKRRAKTRSD